MRHRIETQNTESAVQATGRRWCGYCQMHKPAQGFVKLMARNTRWICPACQAKRKKGAA